MPQDLSLTFGELGAGDRGVAPRRAAELKRLGKAAVLTKPRIALWPATRLATVIEQLIEEL